MFRTTSFWLPGIAAAISLWLAIRSGILAQPVVFVAWFLVGALCQAKGAMFSPLWAAGLVSQVVLAIYLQIKLRVDA